MLLPAQASVDFVDPRTNPDPEAPRTPARHTSNPEELADLHRFCREGRLYDVERWIQAGRPLQLPAGFPIDRRRRFRTALEIAFERQDQALLLLLLANGYDQAAEPECPLDVALRLRRRDLLDLLLEWGADPHQMSVDLLCDTYDTELYERFRALGIDLTSGHALAHNLAGHTSNKPLFGYAKRHLPDDPKIQFELDVALAHHAWEGNEKGVMLCLWAGADPHTPVPFLSLWGSLDDEDEDEWSSAVHAACSGGHATILERLGPDPKLDDYEELWTRASTGKIVEILAREELPADPSRIVLRQIASSAWAFGNRQPAETLEALFKAGARWESSPKEEIGDARRDLLRSGDRLFEGILKLLATGDYSSQEVLTELAGTPAIRKRMKKLHLIPEAERERWSWWRALPTKELVKFGIERPKAKKSSTGPRTQVGLPRTVRIGGWGRAGHVEKLTRGELFERVWTTPVETLAEEWNLSGRGLAKACARLKIPVPPRGYWARVNAGQRIRRPKLPKLPPGQCEEILIRLRETVEDE